MPISRAVHLSPVIEEVKWLKPNTILDVGIGFGLLGVLFRAYTDIRKSELAPELYKNWQTKIDGIEIFPEYKSPAWDFYNQVYVGNALEELDKLGKYDFVYCGDMIEHLTKEDGYALLEKMLDHSNNWVHLVTPSPAPKQEAILGNEFERHLSSWEVNDFDRYHAEFFYNSEGMLGVRIKRRE